MLGWVAEAVVCRTRTSCSRCPAIVLRYLAVVPGEAVTRLAVVRLAVLAVVLFRLGRWDSEAVEGEYWSLCY